MLIRPTSRELIAENEALRARMAYVMEQARAQSRDHVPPPGLRPRDRRRRDLSAAGRHDLPLLPIISDLDIVTLSLVDTDADIYTVMHKLGVDFERCPTCCSASTRPRSASSPASALRPRLGPFARRCTMARCSRIRQGLQSVALVPLLRNKRLIGSLNLGSCDPSASRRRWAPISSSTWPRSSRSAWKT
jgi:two-component system cell cycle response regulator